MPKMMFVALASSALAGAAVTYLAMGRRLSVGALRVAASVLDRAERGATGLRDDISAAWANARMPKTADSVFESDRQHVLDRLEEEQRRLREDLHRLRKAEDRVAFEAILATRNTPPNVSAMPASGETDSSIQTP